jgi:tetratricopeptide (TPR) repeat protein
MQIRAVLFVVVISCQLSTVNSFAQANYQQDYKNAKLFFNERRYNLAMESFKKLIPYDQANEFSNYASFYYALSAYHQKYYSVSKDMLNQIRVLYPKWEKIEDVNYWLALNLFQEGNLFQGMKMVHELKDKKLREDAQQAVRYFVAAVRDAETLRMLLEEYPKEKAVAEQLALLLSKNGVSLEEKSELEKLISQYDLVRGDYLTEAVTPFFKDTYSVAVLFPFVVNRLDYSPSKKPNQFVLDMYQGMVLANDTLAKQGINISLRAYDTERSKDKLKSILETEELKSTDLIIGPLLREDNALIQEFSRTHKVNAFNPLANDSELTKGNPYGFLFQPNYETLGTKSARYLASDTVRSRMKCLVFYGSSVRDSVLAWNFIVSAEKAGIKVILKQEVFKEQSNKITDILATPTEFDEWKAPIQFTIPKDSIGAIFVATDDPVIYTKVVSAVEVRKDNTLIIGSESWLESGSIDLGKFQTMNFVLYAPRYIATHNARYQDFVRQFVKKHGRTPSSLSVNYASAGYELMLMAGYALKKYGVYIQTGLYSETQPGYLMQEADFRDSQSNQTVPFVRFVDGSLELVSKH